MTDQQIHAWIDGIELDLANVASSDTCWRLREQARLLVHESRGIKPKNYELWDTPPGQVPFSG